jgi:hypothetical protein
LRVLLAEEGDLFGELLAGERLDIDDFQFLGLVLDAPVLVSTRQLVLQLPDPLLEALPVAGQVGVVLLVVLDGAVELRLALAQQDGRLGFAGRGVFAGVGALFGLQGLALLVPVELLVAVEGDLVLELGDGVLEFLVLELCGLEVDGERVLVLEEGVVGLPELLLLDVGEGIEVGLAHGAQGVQLVLDLLVRLDDLLDRLQRLPVLLLVGAHTNQMVTISQQKYLLFAF